MVSMCCALRRIKDDPFAVLSPAVIEQVCEQFGHVWRAGPLKPANTVALFVQQIAQGNTSCSRGPAPGGADLQPLGVLSGAAASAAWGAARAVATGARHDRTPNAEPGAVHLAWASHLGDRWLEFLHADTPELQKHFGQPRGQKIGCGFPVAHLLAMFDLHSGLLAEPVASPLYTSDLSRTPLMHRQMGCGNILLGDDTFSTYAHFALILRGRLHAVMPNHHARIVNFTPGRPYARPGDSRAPAGLPRSRFVKSLGQDDQLVEWFKPTTCPWWMSQQQYDQLPDSILVREIRRTIHRRGFGTLTVTAIVTTLLEAQLYPAEELVGLADAALGGGDESATSEDDDEHGGASAARAVEGVLKELAVFVLVYNLIRAVMIHAATRQKVPVDRISFADTLYWLRHAGPEDELPSLLLVPYRPGRVEPRAVKRRPKEYDRLTKPREQLRRKLRKTQENKGEAALASCH